MQPAAVANRQQVQGSDKMLFIRFSSFSTERLVVCQSMSVSIIQT